MHKEAVLKLAAIEFTSGGIDTQLYNQLECDQAYHRKMFTKLLTCIQYLARQRLPLHGHYEDAESSDSSDSTKVNLQFI